MLYELFLFLFYVCFYVQEDFFKALHGHIKVLKWHLRGSIIKVTSPPCMFIPVAAMGKCKQLNSESDVISLLIHERNFANPKLDPILSS